MMETVSVMERGYKKALAHKEKNIDGKLEREDARMIKVERSGSYLTQWRHN